MAAGNTPMLFAPVRRFRALLLLPSTFPSDSGKPNSSPTLKPIVMKMENIKLIIYTIMDLTIGNQQVEVFYFIKVYFIYLTQKKVKVPINFFFIEDIFIGFLDGVEYFGL